MPNLLPSPESLHPHLNSASASFICMVPGRCKTDHYKTDLPPGTGAGGVIHKNTGYDVAIQSAVDSAWQGRPSP